MELKFNYQNWLSRYYAWVFGVNPPNWLCPFFWLIIFLVALSPIIIFFKLISYLFKKFKKPIYAKVISTEEELRDKKRREIGEIIGKIIFGCIIAFATGVLGYGLYRSIMLYDFLDWIINFMIILGMVLGISGIILGGTLLLRKTFTSNIANTIYALIGVIYHKICPHITWVGNPPIQIDPSTGEESRLLKYKI